MKNKIIFFFLAIFLIFSLSCCKKQNSLVTEDFLYFEDLLKNAYAFYDEVNRDSPIKFDIKKLEHKYKRISLYRKIRRRDDSYVNGINQDALLRTLGNFLWKCHFEDGHLGIETEKEIWGIYPKETLYKSDFYFTKKDNDFYLFLSPNEKLVGKKYTGDEKNLKKTFLDGKELYLFAPSLFYYVDKQTLNLDNKKYKVPVKFQAPQIDNKNVLEMAETNRSIYIKSSTFSIVENSSEYNLFMEDLEKIAKDIKEKEFVIVDLRSNHGGYLYYSKLLATAISGMYESEEQKDDFLKFLNKGDRGKLILQSPTIAKLSYEIAIKKNESPNVIEYYKQEYEKQQNENQRYYLGSNDLLLDYLPQFDSFDKKIIILTDCYTASAAEHFIGFCYMLNKNNVSIVGENTSGSLRSGGIMRYELPNSKLTISFAQTNKKNIPLLNYIPNWHGENCGFYPDYWIVDKNLTETIVHLTDDSEIKKILE